VANDAHRSQLTADFAWAGDGVGFPGPGKSLISPIHPVFSLSPNYSEEAVYLTCLNAFSRLKNRVCSANFDVSCMFSGG